MGVGEGAKVGCGDGGTGAIPRDIMHPGRVELHMSNQGAVPGSERRVHAKGNKTGAEARMQTLKEAGYVASQTQSSLPFFLSPVPRTSPKSKSYISPLNLFQAGEVLERMVCVLGGKKVGKRV